MTPNKEKALDKMLEEMNAKHSATDDVIHNWLCEQNDEVLFLGILKPNRSIKGAVQHCCSKAKKYKEGTVAMVEDSLVYTWVREYFLSEDKKADKANPKNENRIIKTHVTTEMPKEKVQSTSNGGEQIDLFDFL